MGRQRATPGREEEHVVTFTARSGRGICRCPESGRSFMGCLRRCASIHGVTIRSCRLGKASCRLALSALPDRITPFLHDLAVAWGEGFGPGERGGGAAWRFRVSTPDSERPGARAGDAAT